MKKKYLFGVLTRYQIPSKNLSNSPVASTPTTGGTNYQSTGNRFESANKSHTPSTTPKNDHSPRPSRKWYGHPNDAWQSVTHPTNVAVVSTDYDSSSSVDSDLDSSYYGRSRDDGFTPLQDFNSPADSKTDNPDRDFKED